MSENELPPAPRSALAQDLERLRERLGLDEEWERLEARLLPASPPETDAALTAALNGFFSELGLRTIGPDWRQAGWSELAHEEAVRALTYLLSEGMAYGTPKRERAAAREGALAFLALFGPSSRLLSNSGLHAALLPDGSPPPGGWGYGSGRSLTQATFEAGIAAMGAGRMGLLWFTDED